jgi:type I restriction enzyme, S subunit
MPIPPEDEQAALTRKAATAIGKLDSINAAMAFSHKQLILLEPSVLAKAFRGELVPQDPNDEPAEAMLARLRGEKGAAPVKGEAAQGSAKGGREAKGGASKSGGR